MPNPVSALTLFYRGSLASCNYACSYCPFAKKRDSRAKLARDAQEVQRFLAWCASQQRGLRIMFTPWGEALTRRHYRQAMQDLLAMPHVLQVALQTNLAGPLAWLEALSPSARGKLALWTTYHPQQSNASKFLARCAYLRKQQVAHSVGMVALQAHFAEIQAMRAALPATTYLWLNAWDRRGPGYYSAEDLQWLTSIDPWFDYNHRARPSRGKPCRAGEDALLVDGNGDLQRCHFLEPGLGNLYQTPLDQILQAKPCPRYKCDCYLGYAQRKDLPFAEAFGEGVWARLGSSLLGAELT